jgi:hypothetical protein
MAFSNQRPEGRRLHSAVVGALLFALLSLCPASPARAQAAAQAPADSQSALTPTEAQRALDALQDAGRRDELIETLRSIAKVASAPAAQSVTPAAASAAAADGLGADVLSEASSKIGELSVEFGHSVRATTKFPLLWRWLTNTASDPQAQQLLLSILWRAVAVALLALLAERLAQFALRRPLAALDARAAREAGPAEPPEPAGAERRSSRRASFSRLPRSPPLPLSAIRCSPPASAKIRWRASRSSLW